MAGCCAWLPNSSWSFTALRKDRPHCRCLLLSLLGVPKK